MARDRNTRMNMNLTITGRLTDCALLSYRTPAESVASLLPAGLELVTRGPWAFWNIVACRVEAMRPRLPEPLPEAMRNLPGGVTYHHVAYRLLVQAMTDRADVRKGLYFVRSDADTHVLGMVGNWMTDFKFHAAKIKLDAPRNDPRKAHRINPGKAHRNGHHGYAVDVSSADGHGDATLRLDPTPPTLAADSCFPTLQDAREFLKYQPYALALTERDGRRAIRIAEVQRDERAWVETPVTLREGKFALFDRLGQTDLAKCEYATRVAPMDYVWKLGRTEPLLGDASRDVNVPAVKSFSRV